MRRRLWAWVISTVVIVLVLFVGNIALSNTPILGLDLQGGVSVILAPVEPATQSDLIVIRDLIRSELENQGIAEPDVRVQGQAIVVDLPGVKDQQEALDAVDVSGVVELRPVVNFTECSSSVVTPSVDPTTTVAGDPSSSTSTPTTSTAPAGFRMAPVDTAPTDTAPADTVPTDSIAIDAVGVDTVPGDSVPTDTIPTDPVLEDLTTELQTPVATGAELLPTRDGQQVCVGPSQATGEVFERGSAVVDHRPGWGVAIDLRSDGQAAWNNLASQCFNTAPTCPRTADRCARADRDRPRRRRSVVPAGQRPSFSDSVAITGRFSQGEAEDLVAVLNRGAFPVEIVAQEARIVSPSAGRSRSMRRSSPASSASCSCWPS